jgi:hypothetical protein
MGEAYIVRKGGVVSETTAAPTITIVTETATGVTFTLTNNDDNTAIISYEVDGESGAVELAAAATSSNITIALDPDTYTLTAYATVVGEVASQSSEEVVVEVIIQFELLYDSNVSATLPLTQIDITGLSIGKNDQVRLVYTLIGDDGTTNANYLLYANDFTTAGNYRSQRLSSIERTRISNAQIATAGSDKITQGYTSIGISNSDKITFITESLHVIGSDAKTIDTQNDNYYVTGTDTVSTITKLSIVSNRTNGIASGSRIKLYKITTGGA